MADLTLERIEKIRADIYQNASDESYWDAREELLDAAERGLTAMEWTVNGPGVEKPKGDCIVRTRDGNYAVMRFREDWWKCPYLVANVRMCFPGSDVTHFMELKEPTDAQ